MILSPFIYLCPYTMPNQNMKIVLITGKDEQRMIKKTSQSRVELNITGKTLGANQGVGYETAKNLVLSAAEYHVILGSRDTSKGEAAAEELRSSPGIKGTISMEQIDVTDQQSIEEAAGRIESKYGRLDILVNNAGIISMASPPTTDALRRVLETNVIGALGVTEAFVPLLRKAASAAAGSSTACVVFVTSSMGSISHAANPTSPYYSPNATEYRVSKAALNMMMTMYGARLKPDGILVFGADPGLCATNFTGDPNSLRNRGAVDASEGGGRIAAVIKTENFDDAGKVHGVYGVCPW